ncbi:MAG: transposase [Chthoniobacterales bacterium]|nr:transposase [Chthoniobacterales bacterium]
MDRPVQTNRRQPQRSYRSRRSWPTAIREQIVSETLAAETTVTEVARRHDVDRSQVYRWRRELGVAGRVRETGMFMPIEVSNESDATAEMAVADPGLIEIDFGGGRCVRVGAGFDADALSRVLDVLNRR